MSSSPPPNRGDETTTETPGWPPFPGDRETLPAGTRLDSYELLEKLGGGGMGVVFRARHVVLKKEFALKILPPRLAHDADAQARFQREAEALGRLEHSHLVRASDAGVADGSPFLVMELLDGVDLARCTQQHGRWPIAETCEAIRQAALGLQHAHEQGLVHRDVKPSNLWLTRSGTIKVLDLGLARLCSEPDSKSLTRYGSWMGTPDYVAPEQILDSHTADIRADLYSLGCTLFYLLTGDPPFGSSTHPTSLKKSEAHLKEAPPDIRQLRPEVPAELADVLGRLMAKRPEERYQTPAQAAAALAPFAANARLERLLTGDSETQPPPGPTVVDTTRRQAQQLVAGSRMGKWPCILILAFGMTIAVFVALSVRVWLMPPPDELQTASPPEPANVQEPAVKVLSLDVTHFPTVNGKSDKARVGVLGKRVFSTRLDDSLTVKGRLSRPAYAFLIAFRPDGTWEVCFPEKDDQPPPLTDTPRFPSESFDYNYGLEEGTGLQVFALVVSSQPLPAFKKWRAQCTGCPWTKHDAPPGIVWRGDGIRDVEPLVEDDATSQRGPRKQVPGKTPVAQLAKWLRSAPQVETVEVLGFAVLPKDKR